MPLSSPHLERHYLNSFGDTNTTFRWDKTFNFNPSSDVLVLRDASQNIRHEWIRKAFINGEGRANNNIKICTWYNAIKNGNDNSIYTSVIGRIGEGLVAEELEGYFNPLEGIVWVVVPGGYEWARIGSSTTHIDIGVYFGLYRPPWPFGSNPGASGIRIPYSDKESGNNELADFRLIDPNNPFPQTQFLEAVIEVKTFTNSSETSRFITEGIEQLSDGISGSLFSGVGLLVIPRERWVEAPVNQRQIIINTITGLEAMEVQVFSYPYPQQQGYFRLSDGLRSRAEGAYRKIKQDLLLMPICECN